MKEKLLNEETMTDSLEEAKDFLKRVEIRQSVIKKILDFNKPPGYKIKKE